MKITVTLTIELDAEKWDPFATQAELRKDVKAYVLNSVQQTAAMQETDAQVSLR